MKNVGGASSKMSGVAVAAAGGSSSAAAAVPKAKPKAGSGKKFGCTLTDYWTK